MIQTEAFETPFVLTIGEKENTKNIDENRYSIKKDHLFILKGSLALSEQRFDEALHYFKDVTSPDLLACGYPCEYTKVILGALKTQLPHLHKMPKKVLKIFAKELSKKFSISEFATPSGRCLILNYGDVLQYLLKKHFKLHPLDKHNFNELEKEILQSASLSIQEK